MKRIIVAALLAFACAAHADLPMRDGFPTLAPILEKVTPAVVWMTELIPAGRWRSWKPGSGTRVVTGWWYQPAPPCSSNDSPPR